MHRTEKEWQEYLEALLRRWFTPSLNSQLTREDHMRMESRAASLGELISRHFGVKIEVFTGFQEELRFAALDLPSQLIRDSKKRTRLVFSRVAPLVTCTEESNIRESDLSQLVSILENGGFEYVPWAIIERPINPEAFYDPDSLEDCKDWEWKTSGYERFFEYG